MKHKKIKTVSIHGPYKSRLSSVFQSYEIWRIAVPLHFTVVITVRFSAVHIRTHYSHI